MNIHLFKLKSFLLAKKIKGRPINGGNDLAVQDPIKKDGSEILVRDAVLLGYRTIVAGLDGEAVDVDVDCYVNAFVGANTKIGPQFLISSADVASIYDVLTSDKGFGKETYAPRLLSLPNIEAFTSGLTADKRKSPKWELLRMALEYNKRFAVVDKGGQIVVFDTSTRIPYTVDEFYKSVANEAELIDYGGKNGAKRVPYSKNWFEHRIRVKYNEITFAPQGRDNHGRRVDMSFKYNLWQVPEVKPSAGDWSLLKEHVRVVLCQSNPEHFAYLMNWLAHLFQKPWDKPGVAIVVFGCAHRGMVTTCSD